MNSGYRICNRDGAGKVRFRVAFSLLTIGRPKNCADLLRSSYFEKRTAMSLSLGAGARAEQLDAPISESPGEPIWR